MGANCSSSDKCCSGQNQQTVYVDSADPNGKPPDLSGNTAAEVKADKKAEDAGGLDTGAIYEGQWRGEEKHGEGKLVFTDGSMYEGQFDSDRKHGKGKYTYSNGSTYEGDWYMEVQEGHGVERLKDGSTFE